MHGFVNRALQLFLLDGQGPQTWQRVRQAAGIRVDGFEPMMHYDDAWTTQLVAASANVLGRPAADILEDFGTYLVSHPTMGQLRRLLRFGGRDFHEFLHSLDDLRDRAILAVPDLDMPVLHLQDAGPARFRLECRWRVPGSGAVILGVLRAMADDYGALVLLDLAPGPAGVEHVCVDLLDARFGEARAFDLQGLTP